MPPKFPPSIQLTVLKKSSHSYFPSPKGLSPSMALLSRKLWFKKHELKEALITPHVHYITIKDSVCLDLFSVALTNRISLISFPAVTEMFQFTAFPFLTESKRKSYSEIPGSKYTFYSPGHNVACHVLHRRLEPSHPPNSIRCILISVCMASLKMNMKFKVQYSFFNPLIQYHSNTELHFLKA